MDIQRMKLAWARGARIEANFSEVAGSPHWLIMPRPDWEFGPEYLRIHPGDEHLQYGPLSSKILQTVEEGNWKSSGPFEGLMVSLGVAAENWFRAQLDYHPTNQLLDQNLVLLAEMLADEGM